MMTNDSSYNQDVFGLTDTLIERPLAWSRSMPAASNTPVLSFVRFRAFYRTLAQHRAVIQLFRAGQWEDALVLVRSMYELSLNLSEIGDSEEAAKKFIRFGKFQRLRLQRNDLDERLISERAKPQRSTQVIDRYLKERAAISSRIDRDFSEFRKVTAKRTSESVNCPKCGGPVQFKAKSKPKKQWQDSWCDLNVEELAKRSAEKAGATGGGSDYHNFRIGSLYTHNAPGALFHVLPDDRETTDWSQFRTGLDAKGGEALGPFVYTASWVLVDIIGMAGPSITGYERKWFGRIALPLLKKLFKADRPTKKKSRSNRTHERLPPKP